MLLTDDDRHDLQLLRLCDFDELEQAAIALAPVASSKQVLKITADTVTALQGAAAEIVGVAMWLLGGVLSEIEHRCAHGYTDEDFHRGWDETHAAWMASLEARGGAEAQ